MTWSLYNNKGEPLNPLKFSNGKTQEDVVKEVLKEIEGGNKIIFIHGVCGTGKSAVALNIAKNIGKTSIIVPGKNLQAQYKKDYEHNKYLLKENREKLKISIITGRSNHICKFIKDNEMIIPKFKGEENSKLNDIFEFSREELEQRKRADKSAEKYDLPCKIEIKEKNSNKIRGYLKNNKRINPSSIETM